MTDLETTILAQMDTLIENFENTNKISQAKFAKMVKLYAKLPISMSNGLEALTCNQLKHLFSMANPTVNRLTRNRAFSATLLTLIAKDDPDFVFELMKPLKTDRFHWMHSARSRSSCGQLTYSPLVYIIASMPEKYVLTILLYCGDKLSTYRSSLFKLIKHPENIQEDLIKYANQLMYGHNAIWKEIAFKIKDKEYLENVMYDLDIGTIKDQVRVAIHILPNIGFDEAVEFTGRIFTKSFKELSTDLFWATIEHPEATDEGLTRFMQLLLLSTDEIPQGNKKRTAIFKQEIVLMLKYLKENHPNALSRDILFGLSDSFTKMLKPFIK